MTLLGRTKPCTLKPYRRHTHAMSLVEVPVAFVILVVAVLTIAGFTALIHRAAHEGKRQALASIEAKSVLEQLKDSRVEFEAAASAGGYTIDKSEYLLNGEADPSKNEAGTISAAQFRITGRATHIAGDIYGLTVTASWDEDGRPRRVVIESRTVRPGR